MSLVIEGVSKVYAARDSNRMVRAVTEVSATLESGQTLGIIGESGCGKSTLARLISGLETPTSGRVLFEGQDVETFNNRSRRELRRRVQMVFQDPYSSLNPRLTAGAAIEEVLNFHGSARSRAQNRSSVGELLERVGLNARIASSFPAQMSGGQRQRVCVARALAAGPSLLVLDEPVSALDVSVRAGIMNLFADLKEQLGLSYVFISHDLGMVRHISNSVMVMYLGRSIEQGDVQHVMETPAHPYTRALLKAAPEASAYETHELIEPVLVGEVPSPTNPPAGCGFNPRCGFAEDACRTRVPELSELEHGHAVRCIPALAGRLPAAS